MKFKKGDIVTANGKYSYNITVPGVLLTVVEMFTTPKSDGRNFSAKCIDQSISSSKFNLFDEYFDLVTPTKLISHQKVRILK